MLPCDVRPGQCHALVMMDMSCQQVVRLPNPPAVRTRPPPPNTQQMRRCHSTWSLQLGRIRKPQTTGSSLVFEGVCRRRLLYSIFLTLTQCGVRTSEDPRCQLFRPSDGTTRDLLDVCCKQRVYQSWICRDFPVDAKHVHRKCVIEWTSRAVYSFIRVRLEQHPLTHTHTYASKR